MTAVAVFAVLVTVALPSFSDFIMTQRVKGATSNLYAALITARSEAMKRNANVSMNRLGSWSGGWEVKLADDTVVLTESVNDSVTVSELDDLAAVTFSWTGRPLSSSAAAEFVISAPGVDARCIALSLSGMPRMTVDTDDNADNGCQT